jgi:hypothetical protein
MEARRAALYRVLRHPATVVQSGRPADGSHCHENSSWGRPANATRKFCVSTCWPNWERLQDVTSRVAKWEGALDEGRLHRLLPPSSSTMLHPGSIANHRPAWREPGLPRFAIVTPSTTTKRSPSIVRSSTLCCSSPIPAGKGITQPAGCSPRYEREFPSSPVRSFVQAACPPAR